AFRDYCQDVPRWIPRLRGLGRPLASVRFRWRRVLLKEYGTPFGWLSILVLMTLYNFWLSGEWRARRPEERLLERVFSLVFACWFVAWRIKRARILHAD